MHRPPFLLGLMPSKRDRLLEKWGMRLWHDFATAGTRVKALSSRTHFAKSLNATRKAVERTGS